MTQNVRIDGMPIKAIKALIKSPKTSEEVKNAWRKKLGKLS